jgi:hypothetical protein
MPKYRYIVINQESKQLEGTIGAPDSESAKRELNQLGFTVISMNEVSEETVSAQAEMAVFEFAAIDKNQRRVVGTIQAQDRYGAFKRLISEYAFQVEYIIDNTLSESDKQNERLKGVLDLQDIINEEQLLVQKKETGEEKDMKEFLTKQEILKNQINFVLNKVKEMLDLYEHEMKIETKAKIRYFVDKLLRIRTSTNLDYVRKTAEDLLMFLQQEELFLNEQAHIKDRTKMIIEAKSMSMQLKKSKTKSRISISDGLRQWRQEHIYDNPNQNGLDWFLNIFVSIVIGPVKESDEILQCRHDIVTVNGQIWQYIHLYTQSSTPEFKAETKEGLKRLFGERKKLKTKLKLLRKEFYRQRKVAGEETSMHKFAVELYSFSGWMLVFYLIYYFASIYVSSKNFGLTEIPNYFFVYRSSFLKYFLAVLFLLHISLGTKIVFFKKNHIASYFISPFFVLASILVLLNF